MKVIFPNDVLPSKKYASKAGPNQGFNPEGVDDILMHVADRLEELYPWWNFQVVELRSPSRIARFVFTFAGYNTEYKPAVAQPDLKDFTIPENTTAGSTLVPETVETPRQQGQTAALENASQ